MNKHQTSGLPSAVGAAERSDGERSETERSGAAPTAGAETPPNPEVRPRGKRRNFSADYKRQILAAADAASGTGAIGALLRREGLYSSHLTHWRHERSAGITQGLTPRTRGPKPQVDPSAKEVQQLRRENERLTEHLRKAEIIIEIQKKVATLLGRTTPTPGAEDRL